MDLQYHMETLITLVQTNIDLFGAKSFLLQLYVRKRSFLKATKTVQITKNTEHRFNKAESDVASPIAEWMPEIYKRFSSEIAGAEVSRVNWRAI